MNRKLIDEKLQRLMEDEMLVACIKTIFDQTVEEAKPDIGEADNVLLGQKYRAYESAKTIIEKGFKTLRSYKRQENEKGSFDKEK